MTWTISDERDEREDEGFDLTLAGVVYRAARDAAAAALALGELEATLG